MFTRVCNAVLRGAEERGWSVGRREGGVLQIVVENKPLELAVAERVEPAADVLLEAYTSPALLFPSFSLR